MKDALIITRCSTGEKRQNISLQNKPCTDYCEKNNWTFDILSYFGSASKGIPKELQQALDMVAKRDYKIILVNSMDRFSRQTPGLTEKMLNHIIDCKCRFISIQENLDSDNTTAANTEFTLTGSQTTNLTNYYSSNWIAGRIYQQSQ